MTRFLILHILANILRQFAFQFELESRKWPKLPNSNYLKLSPQFCAHPFRWNLPCPFTSFSKENFWSFVLFTHPSTNDCNWLNLHLSSSRSLEIVCNWRSFSSKRSLKIFKSYYKFVKILNNHNNKNVYLCWDLWYW